MHKRRLLYRRLKYNIIYNDIINLKIYNFGFIIIFINNRYKYSYCYFTLYKIGVFSAFRNYKSTKEYKDYKFYYLYTDKDYIYINGDLINYYFEYNIV